MYFVKENETLLKFWHGFEIVFLLFPIIEVLE